jgi:hypothetical protein
MDFDLWLAFLDAPSTENEAAICRFATEECL